MEYGPMEYEPGTYGEIFYILKKQSILPNNGIYIDHVVKIVTSNIIKKRMLSCTETDWANGFAVKFTAEAKRQHRLTKGQVYRGRNERVNFFLDQKIDIDFEECPHDPKCDNEAEDEPMEIEDTQNSPGQSNP